MITKQNPKQDHKRRNRSQSHERFLASSSEGIVLAKQKKSIVYLLSCIPSLFRPCSLSSLFDFAPFLERTSPLIDLTGAGKGVLHSNDENPFQVLQSWFEISPNFFDLCFIFSPNCLMMAFVRFVHSKLTFFPPLLCQNNLIKFAFLLIFCEDLCLFGVWL